MRITNKIQTGNYLRNVDRNLNNMTTLEDQMSSGKIIRKPSDNPYEVSRSMEVNASINRNSQYKKNIDDANSWIDMTDEALGELGDYLQRLSELVNAAANTATNSDEEYLAYKDEVQQIAKGMIDVGNTNLNGKYIFGGHKTKEPPFVVVETYDPKNGPKYGPIDYVGEDGSSPDSKDKGLIMREISPKVSLDINVTGDRIMSDGSHDLDVVLGSILSDMNTANASKLTNRLGEINELRDNILNLRAEVGAKSNRLKAASANNESYNYNMTKVLTKIEDIDVTQKAMETKVAEAVYTSSLMVGAKVLQPSLLDFLR